LLTFLFGDVISPVTSAMANKLKAQAVGNALSQEFRSGLWTKDVIRQNGLTGPPIGSRFLNVREVRANGQLVNVKLYEFDRDFRLAAVITAAHAAYLGAHTWRLADVYETHFSGDAINNSVAVWTKKAAS